MYPIYLFNVSYIPNKKKKIYSLHALANYKLEVFLKL